MDISGEVKKIVDMQETTTIGDNDMLVVQPAGGGTKKMICGNFTKEIGKRFGIDETATNLTSSDIANTFSAAGKSVPSFNLTKTLDTKLKNPIGYNSDTYASVTVSIQQYDRGGKFYELMVSETTSHLVPDNTPFVFSLYGYRPLAGITAHSSGVVQACAITTPGEPMMAGIGMLVFNDTQSRGDIFFNGIAVERAKFLVSKTDCQKYSSSDLSDYQWSANVVQFLKV